MTKNSNKKNNLVSKQDKDPQKVEISIQPDYSGVFPTFYSNFALVSHTPSDICIDFCLLAPPHNIETDKKVLFSPMTTRVVVSTDTAKGLIGALESQLQKQKKSIDEGMVIPAHKKGDK